MLDHSSRAVVAIAIFRKEPSASEVCGLLDRAVREAHRAPKYVVSDQGSQFRRRYRRWCRTHRVRPRFGAVGKRGSIAVIERFWRSMNAELSAYVAWYNRAHPHQRLGGATPGECFTDVRPACDWPGLDVENDAEREHRPAATRTENSYAATRFNREKIDEPINAESVSERPKHPSRAATHRR